MTNAQRREPQDKDDDALGSFYMGRMRPPPQPQRVMPRGLLSVLALVAFAIIIWYAYPRGQEKYTNIDIPTIAADTSVYKFTPDDPGGMEVRHQDSTVFDPMERKETDKVENILPKPEEAMTKEEALKAGSVLGDADNSGLNLDMQMQEVSEGTEKIVPKVEEKVAEVAVVKPQPKPETIEKKPEAPKAVTAPKPAPVKTERVPLTSTTVAGGKYIQLGSYRDPSGAKKDWDILRKKYPSLLGGLSMKIETVNLGAKGTWHRLYAGQLSESRANEVCSILKTQNSGGCIVAK